MSKRPSNSKMSAGFGGDLSRKSRSSKGAFSAKRGRENLPNNPKSLLSSTASGLLKGVAACTAVALAPGAAFSLPNGLQVRGGKLTVTDNNGSSLVINQGSNRAAGDWN